MNPRTRLVDALNAEIYSEVLRTQERVEAFGEIVRPAAQALGQFAQAEQAVKDALVEGKARSEALSEFMRRRNAEAKADLAAAVAQLSALIATEAEASRKAMAAIERRQRVLTWCSGAAALLALAAVFASVLR